MNRIQDMSVNSLNSLPNTTQLLLIVLKMVQRMRSTLAIQTLASMVKEEIVESVKACRYFSIQADEC